MHPPGRLDDGQPLRYAAGWEIDRYRSHHVLRHGGMGIGFQSHIAWFRDVEIGVAILGNLRPCWPWPAANRVLDVLLDGDLKTPLRAGACKIGPAEKCNLLGRYFTSTGLPVFVEWPADRLMIDLWLWRTPFERQSPYVFTDVDTADTVTFHRDIKGKVIHFTLTTRDGACSRMHSPVREAVKYENADLVASQFQAYQGRYHSDELETVYTVVVEPGGLRAKHLRCYDWHLRPIKSCLAGSFDDEFAQPGEWPGIVTFKRDTNGKISGFRVRGKSVNLFFRKAGPLPRLAGKPENLVK